MYTPSVYVSEKRAWGRNRLETELPINLVDYLLVIVIWTKPVRIKISLPDPSVLLCVAHRFASPLLSEPDKVKKNAYIPLLLWACIHDLLVKCEKSSSWQQLSGKTWALPFCFTGYTSMLCSHLFRVSVLVVIEFRAQAKQFACQFGECCLISFAVYIFGKCKIWLRPESLTALRSVPCITGELSVLVAKCSFADPSWVV